MEIKAGSDSDAYWSRLTFLESAVFGICGVWYCFCGTELLLPLLEKYRSLYACYIMPVSYIAIITTLQSKSVESKGYWLHWYVPGDINTNRIKLWPWGESFSKRLLGIIKPIVQAMSSGNELTSNINLTETPASLQVRSPGTDWKGWHRGGAEGGPEDEYALAGSISESCNYLTVD